MLNTLGEMKTNGWTNLTMQHQSLKTGIEIPMKSHLGLPSPPLWAPWGSWGRRACWGPPATRCRSPGALRTTPGSGWHQADPREPWINTFCGENKKQWPVVRYYGDFQAMDMDIAMLWFCSALLFSYIPFFCENKNSRMKSNAAGNNKTSI